MKYNNLNNFWNDNDSFKHYWHTKKSDKIHEKNKRFQLQGEIGEIRINYFTRTKNNMGSN